METTLEDKFFSAYRCLGVVDNAIFWLTERRNLPCIADSENKERSVTNADPIAFEPLPTDDEATKAAKAKWEALFYFVEEPQIIEATKTYMEAFNGDSSQYRSLFAEIAANIEGCKSDEAKHRYLTSLLLPFGEAQSRLASTINPVAEAEEHRQRAEKVEALGYEDEAKEERQQAKWLEYRGQRLLKIIAEAEAEADSVERCLAFFVGFMHQYAKRLYALLLTFGIDLNRLQKECGIYLQSHYEITDAAPYLGDKMAQEYIAAIQRGVLQLPWGNGRQTENTPVNGIFLPVELEKYREDIDTPKVRVCFSVAISKGLIEKTPTGYSKNKGISKAQLAYFLQCVYVDPKKGGKMPTALNNLFGESDLKQAAYAANNGNLRGKEIVDDILREAKEIYSKEQGKEV